MNNSYTRPAKTKATALGERNRTHWTRQLRKKLFTLASAPEIMAAEETSIVGAIQQQMKAPRHMRWDDRPRWVSVQIRIDQMAIIETLQTRHLRTTGKEISRAEVMAALMAEGLERIINHREFGGTNAPLSN
jgi:hypothetical protein